MKLYLEFWKAVFIIVGLFAFAVGASALDSEFVTDALKVIVISVVAFGGAGVCHLLQKPRKRSI